MRFVGNRFVVLCAAGALPAFSASADPVVEKLLRVHAGEMTVVLDRDISRPLGLLAGTRAALISDSSTMLAASANDEFVRTFPGGIRTTSPGSFVIVGGGQDPEVAEFAITSADEATNVLNLYGVNYTFDAAGDSLHLEAQLRLDAAFAKSIGHADLADTFVGRISVDADMKLHSWTMYDGEVAENVLPPENPGDRGGPNPGIVDVIVGDLPSTQQFGRVGSQVGLAVGTTSCNKGTIPLNWLALPNTDHPVIPQNMYRLKNDRFEQLGHSFLKHAFTALQGNACGFGCTSGCSGSSLCGGCSDPYDASLNAGPNLGARAWVQPFTGVYPNTANSHSSHTHNGISHRIIVNDTDLTAADNPGALYFVEGHYVTPHEYNHVASRTARANMNNVSYRRVTPSGAAGGTWTFSNNGSTIREQPAINAWTGATRVNIEPDAGNDGMAILAYKVTNPTPGTWHYEYALYNMNLDRSLSAFSVPVGAGANISNVGFYAPAQHPGWLNDGTGGVGFSNTAWASQVSGGNVEWRTQDFVTNANANAIRWGMLYNFRFDSDQPPQNVNGAVETFKIVASVAVATQGPQAAAAPCPGDLTDDNLVDLNDLTIFLANFGQSGVGPDDGDMDGDGDIDLSDLTLFLSLFGATC